MAASLPANVATALTVYGIETVIALLMLSTGFIWVATALTVYGIETQFLLRRLKIKHHCRCNSSYRLRY